MFPVIKTVPFSPPIVYTMTLLANVIGGLILMFHAGEIGTFFLAIFYTLLFSPASYVCW